MKNISFSVFCILSASLVSQEWAEMMTRPGQNFYSIQTEFNEYWKNKDVTEKGKGYKQFKRWEHYMEPRIYPSGDLSLPSTNYQNFIGFAGGKISGRSSALSSSSTWTAIGPMGAMTGSVSGLPRKAGRDNFITFHPTQSGVYWAGAPAGGLWKTTDNGLTWTTNTDYLPVIGCSDLAIDPVNTNIIYMATGDGDGADTYCIGVLKSTDGGNTWNPSGLTFQVNQLREMRRLIINPVNPQILIAATNVGLFRTTDAGASWTQLLNGANIYDVEFKPGDPNTVYAAGGAFYRSINAGASFMNVSLPNVGINRINIAVTAADPDRVYLVASNSSDNGLNGVFVSTNSAATFSQAPVSQNLLANSCAGSGTGGQGWYDLAIAASPTNAAEVVIGGVNTWRSTNSGSTWTNIGCWNTQTNYVHADHHELEYNPAGVLYSANDGGVFSRSGNIWVDRTGTRNIAQIYKIGLSTLSPNLWITGHQDNGSNVYTGTTYNASLAGDGMDCFIDRTNNNNMFASQYNGQFKRSTNGGASWSNATTGMSGSAEWVAPWKQDPVVATRLYAGRTEMFISNDLGVNWVQAGIIGGSGMIREFAVAPSNNQVIYAIKGPNLRRTINGGASWTVINNGLPTGSAALTFITVDPGDANTLWVTFSGYSAANKVFKSINGGASWTNITANLPNLPANCSVYQPNSSDRIYVGMDVGVYYRDNSSGSWTLYNTGLPNVPVADLEISPAAPGLLRAATYGRGVWQVDLVQSTSSPESNFTLSTPTVCAGVPFMLNDASSEGPNSWSWSVTPASGATLSSATAPNPTVSFINAGTYQVSMQAGNTFGMGAPVTKTITVNALPVVSFVSTGDTICKDAPVTITAQGAASYTWNPGNVKSAAITLTATGNTTYSVNAQSAQGCKSGATHMLIVSECTSINEMKTENFSLYPNPVKEELEIRGKTNSSVQIEIFDSSGRLVYKAPANVNPGEVCRIKVSQLSAGFYTVKLSENKDSFHTLKFIKE